jgi:hypothetical protein
MLNPAQRASLRIVLGLIEEKMRAIEQRLVRPEEHAVTYEVSNDLTPEMAQAVRDRMQVVNRLVRDLHKRFGLSMKNTPATTVLLEGLPQLWVALQEIDSKNLARYGPVDPQVPPRLDPEIATLGALMLELQGIVMQRTYAESGLANPGKPSSG